MAYLKSRIHRQWLTIVKPCYSWLGVGFNEALKDEPLALMSDGWFLLEGWRNAI